MNQLAPIRSGQEVRAVPHDLTPAQITLIRKTVAKDCNQDEFDLFVAVCRRLRLDPLRKQIYAFVFSKDDLTKRRMSIITGIDGFRTIAARCGDYRPMETEPAIEYDDALKGPDNPLGIVRAVVRVWKRSADEWHPVAGEAYWEEFAPFKEDCEAGFDWIDTGEVWPDSGKPKKKKVARGEKVRVLDTSGNWGRMGRLMIAKCAEAQALRRGWPDDLSGVYAEEEMARAVVMDITASEAVSQYEEDQRQKRLGGSEAVMLCVDAGQPLERVERGKLADRLFEVVRDMDDADGIAWFLTTNKAPLQQFWAWDKGDAHQFKVFCEQRVQSMTMGAPA